MIAQQVSETRQIQSTPPEMHHGRRLGQGKLRKVRVSMALHSGAMQLQPAIAWQPT